MLELRAALRVSKNHTLSFTDCVQPNLEAFLEITKPLLLIKPDRHTLMFSDVRVVSSGVGFMALAMSLQGLA